MGRRKFRLTVRKNYEKKKYQKRLTVAVDTVCDVAPGLVIHVPINFYLSAPASSFHVLCNRIRKYEVVQKNGWVCTGVSDNVIKKSFSSYEVTIKIQPDFTFTIEVGEYQLNNCSYLQVTEVKSVLVLLRLLEMIDKSTLCIGNPDEKFENTQRRRNGKFFDHTGTLLIIFVVV